jgi:rhodanese-related sulfurtransferase
MKTLIVALLVTLGCSKAPAPAADRVEVATVSVDQLDRMLATSTCQAVDANGDLTRKKLGVIPGAVLLTDFEGYAMTELPTDKGKPLVFYCANTECSASHHAAEKAIAAGYRDVKVLPAGIAGWRNAGKKTQSI